MTREDSRRFENPESRSSQGGVRTDGVPEPRHCFSRPEFMHRCAPDLPSHFSERRARRGFARIRGGTGQDRTGKLTAYCHCSAYCYCLLLLLIATAYRSVHHSARITSSTALYRAASRIGMACRSMLTVRVVILGGRGVSALARKSDPCAASRRARAPTCGRDRHRHRAQTCHWGRPAWRRVVTIGPREPDALVEKLALLHDLESEKHRLLE